jgi:hypothetical protein
MVGARFFGVGAKRDDAGTFDFEKTKVRFAAV